MVIRKSDGLVPARTTDATCKAVLPLLVRVMVCDGLATPWVVAGNDTKDELKVAPDCEAIPVPESEIFCGESGASSLMVMEAEREPAPTGVNAMLIEQV